ncbi:hypothetical protein PO909_005149 [Leuciscus waleckii]
MCGGLGPARTEAPNIGTPCSRTRILGNVFEMCRCGAFSPQVERNAHSKLPGRLADSRSLKRNANRPCGSSASPLEYAWNASKRPEKCAHTESNHYVFGGMFGFGEDASPSLPGASGGSKFISESVVLQPQAYHSYPQLRSRSGAVEKHGVIQLRSPPGHRDTKRRGFDGRVDLRLGSGLLGRASFGSVVRTAEEVAHKPPGANGGLPGPQSLSVSVGATACADPDRQHVRSFIYKSPRRHSKALFKQAQALLLWADRHFLSVRAAHIPGVLNRGADMLSRNGIPQGEWRLHPGTVQLIWNHFGRAEINLFATDENTHCQAFFSLTRSPLGGNALTSCWPKARLYAFPPVKILPMVLCKIREEKASVILVVPNWPNQPWFADMRELLAGPPWEIPLSCIRSSDPLCFQFLQARHFQCLVKHHQSSTVISDLCSKSQLTLKVFFGNVCIFYMQGFWVDQYKSLEYWVKNTSIKAVTHCNQDLAHDAVRCVFTQANEKKNIAKKFTHSLEVVFDL